jgi:SAM-dependent methyltransferase
MPGSEKEYEYWGKRASTHDDDFLYIVGLTIPRGIKGWLILQFEVIDTVLELGCGSGGFSEMIADGVKYLTATDLAPEMIEKAKGKLSQFGNVEVQKEDCYNTSFTDNTFDAVLMVNLLHIGEEPVTVLEESRRVLKDDGRVVIVGVTGYGMSFYQRWVWDFVIYRSGVGPHRIVGTPVLMNSPGLPNRQVS